MFLNRLKILFFQLLILIAVAAVAVIAIWALLLSVPKDEPVAEIAEMTRLQTSAQLYFNRVRFYTGVCRDMGAKPPYNCNDSETAYAVEVPLPAGGYYCIDSTGYSDKRVISKLNSPSCPK